MRRLFLAFATFLLLPAPLAAQLRPGQESAGRYPLPASASAVPASAWAPPESWRESPATVVVASSLLPGAGQWLQGQRRWVPYLALEVWSWLRYREHRSDASALAARYRDVAWKVARRVSIGARRDTTFEYYEAMADEDFSSSGAFDASATEEGLQPERQRGTFNGELWDLASRLYFGGEDYGPGTPQYEAALAYYRARAIPDAYAWAWGANLLERKVFQDLIHESDEAYRNGTRVLGLIVANHIASGIDALISSRLRQATPGNARLRTGFVPEGDRIRLDARLHIGF